MGKTGTCERDAELFSRDMIAWSSLVAVLWGVAEGDRARRAIDNVKRRLSTPYGLKFYDPIWKDGYTAAVSGWTYGPDRWHNGGYWHAWWSLPSLASAENMLGRTEEAFRDLMEFRLDTLYRRFTLTEKGTRMHLLPVVECVDADMTFGVTSIPYTITAAFFNQALLESVLGVQVSFDGIRIEPHLPATWQWARIGNLTVGDSVWDIEIHGHGAVLRISADGQDVHVLPIRRGRHRAEVYLGGETGGENPST